MKMRKFISVLASLALSASCFVALATSAFAADATISVDTVKITDFTGEYAEYADYDMTADGFETYLLTFNATNLELETAFGTGMSKNKVTGNSIGSWTIQYRVNAEGTKDEDYMVEDVYTLGSEVLNTWNGTLKTVTYGGGTAPMYPAAGQALTIASTDKIPLYKAIIVKAPENKMTLSFERNDSFNITVIPIKNDNYTGVQADKKEYVFTMDPVTVEAKAEEIAVTAIKLDQTALELDLNGTKEATLVATVEPENATDPTVTWATSDETVAKVVNGKVTAFAVGTTTITATAGDQSATCEVTVVDTTPVYVQPGETFTDIAVDGMAEGNVLIYVSKVADGANAMGHAKLTNTTLNETFIPTATIAELLGGEAVDGATISGAIIVVVSAPEGNEFSFEIVD